MSKRRLRIVSDGNASNTFVLDANGDRLKLGDAFLTGIRIAVRPGGLATAFLRIEGVGLDIDATAEVPDG